MARTKYTSRARQELASTPSGDFTRTTPQGMRRVGGGFVPIRNEEINTRRNSPQPTPPTPTQPTPPPLPATTPPQTPVTFVAPSEPVQRRRGRPRKEPDASESISPAAQFEFQPAPAQPANAKRTARRELLSRASVPAPDEPPPTAEPPPPRVKRVAPMTPIQPPQPVPPQEAPPPPMAAAMKNFPRMNFIPTNVPPIPPAEPSSPERRFRKRANYGRVFPPPDRPTEPVDNDKLKPLYYFTPPPQQKGVIPDGPFKYGNNRVATIQSEWPYEKLITPIRYDKVVKERERCPRCLYIKPDGIQCRLRTCKTGPYCWQHTSKSSKLRVTKSKEEGAGQGLFAWGGVQVAAVGKVVFRAGEEIMNYHLRAEIYTQRQNRAIYRVPFPQANETAEQREHRFAEALNVYGIQDKDASQLVPTDTEYIIDTRAANSNVARYANDCRRPGNECQQIYNAYVEDGILKATRDIYHGEEIIWSYGAEYWNIMPNNRRQRNQHEEFVRNVKIVTG